MTPQQFAWRNAVACAALLTAIDSVPATAQPQRTDCELRVQAVAGPTGYKKRDYGCEGFYVQPQANLNIQVLSLRQGSLSLDASDVLLIAVPRLPDSLATTVTVLGAGLVPGLNWALDGALRSGAPMRWRVSEVARGAGLRGENIGLMARTASGVRFATPWYVAVRVAGAQTTPDALNAAQSTPTELEVRVPSAGSLRCRVKPDTRWTAATPGDGDGRFRCAVPASHHGAAELQISWRPRGAVEWSDVESLRLWLW